jgi:hypothetical protein
MLTSNLKNYHFKSKNMITARIDVTKILKEHLFKGEKGTYLDIVLIDVQTPKSGNDYMVKQDCGKDNRDTAPILGNGKTLVKKESSEPPAGIYERTGKLDRPVTKQDDTPTDTDDLPFIVTILLAVGTLSQFINL